MTEQPSKQSKPLSRQQVSSMGLMSKPCQTCGCKWGYVDTDMNPPEYDRQLEHKVQQPTIKCGSCDREQTV